MNVILVSVDRFELKVRIVLVDGLNSRHDEGLNAFVDDLTSVFGRKHQVVVTNKYTVGLMTIDSWHQAL